MVLPLCFQNYSSTNGKSASSLEHLPADVMFGIHKATEQHQYNHKLHQIDGKDEITAETVPEAVDKQQRDNFPSLWQFC